MEKVRVYWNLRKYVWSIVSCKSGLVIDYMKYLTLLDAYFTVWESGQKRVREEGKKNVHAFAVGYLMSSKQSSYHDWDRVKYNPYTDDYFMHQRHDDNQYKPKEWNEIPRDFSGWILMDSTENGNPRVFI
mgnify:CR=1 FL=1